MIICSGLTKLYGKDPNECALHSLDFHLDKGEFVFLRGHVGAGKSTLLRLVCGLLEPSSGELIVNGVSLPANRRRLAALRRRMGIVEQEPRLLEDRSVAENIALALEVQGLKGPALKRRVSAALRSVGLESLSEAPPRRLSAGQRQKVAVARAVAGEPLLVVADEPCRHLDSEGAAEVLALLRWLNLQGSTILAVMGDCWPGAGGDAEVAARCLWLKRGRLLDAPAEAGEEGAACAC